MSLPVRDLPTSSVEVNGATVEIRAMSRAQALNLQRFQVGDDFDGAERFIIVCGTGCTDDEAEAFRVGSTTRDAGDLVDAILELSGLTGDGGRDPKSATSGPS